MKPASDTDLLGFRSVVARRLGLWFDEHRRDFLADVLRERLAARGCAVPADYLEGLAACHWPDEIPALAERLTVAETYFFRGNEHLQALVETALPELCRARPAPRPLRLLSAGCASGEEAYSLAIVLKENPGVLAGRPVEIIGADINRDMLAKARQGRYTAWSLRATRPELRHRYFSTTREGFVLDEAIVASATFHERNLVEPNEDLWLTGAFDAVFCRNLLMYFEPGKAAELVERIQRALAPGGFLFLGHAETLRGVSQAFHLRHSHGAFYYQRRAEAEVLPPPGVPEQCVSGFILRNESTGAASAPVSSPAWMAEIGRASARIATLAASAEDPGAKAGSAGPGADPVQIDRIFALHRQERFAEALAQLQRLPAGADLTLQLLRAVLLVNCGRLSEAEAVSRSLLGRDDLNAGAHYVAALCREHADDFAAAEEHDEAAAYLDPLFAMPRFHHGRLCKRAGRETEALGHFEEALVLFAREDALRLLLFGGGFSREALMQACRGEVQQLQGILS